MITAQQIKNLYDLFNDFKIQGPIIRGWAKFDLIQKGIREKQISAETAENQDRELLVIEIAKVIMANKERFKVKSQDIEFSILKELELVVLTPEEMVEITEAYHNEINTLKEKIKQLESKIF